MRPLMTRINILSCFVSAMVLAGCGSSSSGGGSTETGSLSFSVTDAPIDNADNVFVEFTGIEIKPAGGSSILFNFDTPKKIDLLAQQGGNSALLITNEAVPSGDYNWIRLAVNAESDGDPQNHSYIVINNTPHELEVPSGSQSGLKLNTGFTVPAGGSANFTIDFDLRHSVVLASGDYKLKPVLRLIDNEGAATLSGMVDSTLISTVCTDANVFAGAVYLYSGHDVVPDDIDINAPNPIATATVALNDQATEYVYTAAFLPAGNYTVTYSCDTDDADVDDSLNFQPATNISLAASANETVNF